MESVTTVRQAQRQATETLLSHSDTARMDADILVGHCLQKNRTWLMTWPDHVLLPVQQVQLASIVARRVDGEPIAYIVGEQEFWSLSLQVDRSTLIPRPETELLVELVLEKVRVENASVLDLGTGSGAIALALKSEHPRWDVTAIDFSDEALTVAKNNSHLLSLDVEFIQSNWFSNVTGQQFDVIVSNPPYIDKTDLHLSLGDLRFEPDSALVASENGYGDYQRICLEVFDYLKVGGIVLFEHGFEQGAGVRDILRAAGFSSVETVRDLAGLDRVTFGHREER